MGVVSIVTRVPAEWLGVRISVGTKDLSFLFISSAKRPEASGLHPASYQCVLGVLSPGYAAKHSSSSVEIKNKWILTSTESFTYGSEICSHGKNQRYSWLSSRLFRNYLLFAGYSYVLIFSNILNRVTLTLRRLMSYIYIYIYIYIWSTHSWCF